MTSMTKMTESDWEELEKYANLCYDEYGEAISLCIALFRSDQISNKLKMALQNESAWNLNNLRENTVITKRKETRIDEYEDLEWIL